MTQARALVPAVTGDSTIRGLYARHGYTEVITPLIYKTELYKRSGHYDAFHDDMFLMAIDEVNARTGRPFRLLQGIEANIGVDACCLQVSLIHVSQRTPWNKRPS